MKAFSYAVLLCVVHRTHASSLCASGDGWVETWRDDFEGDGLDESTWTVLTTHGDSRVRDACGTNASLTVRNGSLTIRSDKGTVAGCPYNITTGAIESRGKRSWQGNTRVCVNAILPGVPGKGNGIWPAHWLLPDNDACWPTNGEIDILEMINADGKAHQTYHYSDTCSVDQHSSSKQITVPTWNTAFHEYGVEYNTTHMVYFVDNTPVNVVDRNATFYDIPYYAILQTAVGGPWPRPVDANTVFPVDHIIDSFVVTQKH